MSLFSIIKQANFHREVLSVHIDQLVQNPQGRVLSTVASHVEALAARFAIIWYFKSNGLIKTVRKNSLCMLAPPRQESDLDGLEKFVSEDTMSGGLSAFIFCDGDHRTDALNMAFDKEIAENDIARRRAFVFFHVMVWAPLVGAQLSRSNMLMVGASSNAAREIEKQMNLRDTLCMCAQFADCAEAELRQKNIIKGDAFLNDEALAQISVSSGRFCQVLLA